MEGVCTYEIARCMRGGMLGFARAQRLLLPLLPLLHQCRRRRSPHHSVSLFLMCGMGCKIPRMRD